MFGQDRKADIFQLRDDFIALHAEYKSLSTDQLNPSVSTGSHLRGQHRSQHATIIRASARLSSLVDQMLEIMFKMIDLSTSLLEHDANYHNEGSQLASEERRRRGRPSRGKVSEENQNDETDVETNEQETSVEPSMLNTEKRRPGRPPKRSVENQNMSYRNERKDWAIDQLNPTRRRPGRPKRILEENQESTNLHHESERVSIEQADQVVPKRKPGRPRKIISELTESHAAKTSEKQQRPNFASGQVVSFSEALGQCLLPDDVMDDLSRYMPSGATLEAMLAPEVRLDCLGPYLTPFLKREPLSDGEDSSQASGEIVTSNDGEELRPPKIEELSVEIDINDGPSQDSNLSFPASGQVSCDDDDSADDASCWSGAKSANECHDDDDNSRSHLSDATIIDSSSPRRRKRRKTRSSRKSKASRSDEESSEDEDDKGKPDTEEERAAFLEATAEWISLNRPTLKPPAKEIKEASLTAEQWRDIYLFYSDHKDRFRMSLITDRIREKYFMRCHLSKRIILRYGAKHYLSNDRKAFAEVSQDWLNINRPEKPDSISKSTLVLTTDQRRDIFDFFTQHKNKFKRSLISERVAEKYFIVKKRIDDLLRKMKEGRGLIPPRTAAATDIRKNPELIAEMVAYAKANPLTFSCFQLAKKYGNPELPLVTNRDIVSRLLRKNGVKTYSAAEKRAMRMNLEGKEYVPFHANAEVRKYHRIRKKERLKKRAQGDLTDGRKARAKGDPNWNPNLREELGIPKGVVLYEGMQYRKAMRKKKALLSMLDDDERDIIGASLNRTTIQSRSSKKTDAAGAEAGQSKETSSGTVTKPSSRKRPTKKSIQDAAAQQEADELSQATAIIQQPSSSHSAGGWSIQFDPHTGSLVNESSSMVPATQLCSSSAVLPQYAMSHNQNVTQHQQFAANYCQYFNNHPPLMDANNQHHF